MEKLLFLFATIGLLVSSKDPIEVFKEFENESKTIAINIEKKNFKEKCMETFKLKSSKYFKIVPLKYEIKYDTISLFDPSRYVNEMGVLYKMVTEQIQIKEGGYKWIMEEKKINNTCDTLNQFEQLNENQLRLKYQQVFGEYETIKKLVFYSAHNAHIEPEKLKELTLKATRLAKEGMREIVMKKQVVKAHGYIQELSEEDLCRIGKEDENVFQLEKGRWSILKEGKEKQECEISLKQIQCCLHRLGYDTNIDGIESKKYKMAKHSFFKESKLQNRKDETFIKALGW